MEYTLIKNSLNQIYTFDKINSIWIDTGLFEPLTIDQIKNNGITQIQDITESQWDLLPYNEIQLLVWTDNTNINTSIYTSKNGYRPIDLIENPKLIYYTSNNNIIKMNLSISAIMKLRIAISKDGRNTWYVFKNGGWQNILLTNISTDGMLVSEVNAITDSNYISWFKRGNLDFAIYTSSQSNVEFLSVKKIEVNFPENESPFIENLLITPTQLNRENVTIKADLRDLEGDLIRYKLLINDIPFGFENNNGWSDWVDGENTYKINYSLPFYNFQPNDNTIKIITEDDRHKSNETLPQIVTMINHEPVVSLLTHNNWNVSGVITDLDNDDIRYRVLINDKQVYPKTQMYTDFLPSPYSLYYEWNSSDLVFNSTNTVTIEIMDKANAKHTIQFNDIIGKYKNLMFKDTEGNYYSDDKGDLINWKNNILSYLDFGIMVAGATSEPKKVILENDLGNNVENAKVYLDTNDLIGYDVHISDNQDFIINTGNDPAFHEIKYDGIINVGDQKEFFVRVTSNVNTKSVGGIFKILTSSDLI